MKNLLYIVITLLFINCSKDEEITPVTEPEVPSYEVVSLHYTLTSPDQLVEDSMVVYQKTFLNETSSSKTIELVDMKRMDEVSSFKSNSSRDEYPPVKVWIPLVRNGKSLINPSELSNNWLYASQETKLKIGGNHSFTIGRNCSLMVEYVNYFYNLTANYEILIRNTFTNRISLHKGQWTGKLFSRDCLHARIDEIKK
jgi:hypothetical protein